MRVPLPRITALAERTDSPQRDCLQNARRHRCFFQNTTAKSETREEVDDKIFWRGLRCLFHISFSFSCPTKQEDRCPASSWYRPLGEPDCHENDGCKAESGADDVRVVQLSALLRKSGYVAALKDINLSIPLRLVTATLTPPQRA